MTSSAAQIRAYHGPVLFSYGFRPFFLFGALWAALSVALWLPMRSGQLSLPTTLSPVQWHVHELLFGYVPAVVAGFLLTAVPNWTGRLPVVGWRLMALFLAWVAGRLAVMLSAVIGGGPAAAIDLAFLIALAAVVAREIVAAGNLRHLRVLAVVTLLLAGNALFHLEALGVVGAGHGLRLGLAATVVLIMLIGGRIIPSFTRNWLAKRGPGRLPAPFDRFDGAVMAASAVALAAWVAAPDATATAWLALVGAVLNAARLGRWAGQRTGSEPLVLVLHVAYAFVPLGFLLVALAVLKPGIVASTGAVHGWTAGAIGLMTLAVMTRASLGHTGRPLVATPPVQMIYVAALVAALTRIGAAFPLDRELMLTASVLAWVVAFGGFVAAFGPLLSRRR
jgi:uncharacterized protein involved in response to NO